uniref:Uncharacterized protein n=1 Tax=Anguilla anguilla TaxID=7936 RepID=A0A0E9U502_ANGAN
MFKMSALSNMEVCSKP